jgi:hypothetical protein
VVRYLLLRVAEGKAMHVSVSVAFIVVLAAVAAFSLAIAAAFISGRRIAARPVPRRPPT